MSIPLTKRRRRKRNSVPTRSAKLKSSKPSSRRSALPRSVQSGRRRRNVLSNLEFIGFTQFAFPVCSYDGRPPSSIFQLRDPPQMSDRHPFSCQIEPAYPRHVFIAMLDLKCQEELHRGPTGRPVCVDSSSPQNAREHYQDAMALVCRP